MAKKENFINEGFTVLGEGKYPNELYEFIKSNYPNIINDNEINLIELKNALGLPIDNKVNGYGINFIGRQVARAKYAAKTEKELRINKELSRDFDSTQNIIIKGDNIDCLKIMKSHYNGKIKCIYIDPPYNTSSDEFVYPDKFDKEEREILGLANLSDDDIERMEFSFKTKKSHNGWLSFMYPRLLLARELLSQDGVIFISIDDNEQANLKILCDEIFGEDNFVGMFAWRKKVGAGADSKLFFRQHEYILLYSKNAELLDNLYQPLNDKQLKEYSNPDRDVRGKWAPTDLGSPAHDNDPKRIYKVVSPTGKVFEKCWSYTEENFKKLIDENLIWWGSDNNSMPKRKRFLKDKMGLTPRSWIDDFLTQDGRKDLVKLNFNFFDYPKPANLIKRLLEIGTNSNAIIFDFFAGSGTTGQAVMEMNKQDGGNRKFILCQIDEPISQDKPAYSYCLENNLEPYISSITIERLRRAGDKIKQEIEEENKQNSFVEEDATKIPDIGYKVFDTVDAPKLELEDGEIVFKNLDNDALSRIYNLIFTVGIDEPSTTPECVKENCVYKLGNNYYITNSEDVESELFSEVISKGKVFIDGWTASLNATLQHYKEDIKIVF